MVKIYLVRHCQTEGNLARYFQGSIDTPVSENGKIQLDLLSVRFRNIKYDYIYTSPLGRAVATAEAVNRFHDNEIIPVDDFREIHAGKIEKVSWSDIPILFPEQARNWNERAYDFAPPEGEKMTEVYDRMSSAFERVLKFAKDGETIVIVSHGAALRTLNCYLKFHDIKRLNDMDIGVNTAVSLWKYENGNFEAEYMNDGSHLPDWTPGKNLRANFFLTENKG